MNPSQNQFSSSINIYSAKRPSKLYFNNIFEAIFKEQQKASKSNKAAAAIIACPNHEFCRWIIREYNKNEKSNNILLTNDTSLFASSEDDNKKIIYILTYSAAANSKKLLENCDAFWILEGHSIASYEYFAILNQLLAELTNLKKPFNICLDIIPSLNPTKFNNLLEEFLHRYQIKKLSNFSFNSEPKEKTIATVSETIVECSINSGVEIMLGELEYFKEGESRSECPLTDTMLSIVSGCIEANKTMIIVCVNDAEAKDIAERVNAEFNKILIKNQPNLPTSRMALTIAMKLIGGVILAENAPYSEKDDGFVSYLNSNNFLVVVGSKKRLLYTGLKADVVINLIHAGASDRAMLDSEYSALFNLSSSSSKNGSVIITLTDDITKSFSQFIPHPRLFNKTILNLISSGKATNTQEIENYVMKNFFISEIDCSVIIKDLINNGAMIETHEGGGHFEIIECKYLSGFYGIEKRRLLSETFTSMNFKDTLYLFFLANVYFVDGSESHRLSKATLNLLFSDPEIKQLCEKAKLRDPKIGGNHYLKLESSILVSAILYKFYSNLNEGSELTEFINNFDRLENFISMNQQNLHKTANIAEEYYGTSFSNIFKHLENICIQFNSTTLQNIHGLDFETIDYLISRGIKTINQFIHCPYLEGYLKPLAAKRKTTARLLSQQLRNEALNTNKKPKRRRSSFLNGSGNGTNTSCDLFSTSAVGDEIAAFKSLCILDEPNLSNAFSLTPEASVFLQVKENNWITIIKFDGSGDTVIYKHRLKCCLDCKNSKRMEEILDICKKGIFYVDNILLTARIFALSSIQIDNILDAYCLNGICYVIGSNGLSMFIENCSARAKNSWPFFYQSVLSGGSFSQEVTLCFNAVLPCLNQIRKLPMVKMVKKAFEVLGNVYGYGIPYNGYDNVMKAYNQKLSSMPKDIVKIANSKFITSEFHKKFADNVASLLRTKATSKPKLVSTDIATSEQSDIVYSQLSQIRRLNQAIELLNEEYFTQNSDVVYPAVTFSGHGRLYTHAPNLQNFAKTMPFHDVPSPRSIIRVKDAVEEDLWSADFREIELRIVAAMSKDKVLHEALKSPNTFQCIAAKLGVEDYPRASVKLFFYGLLYGMGPNTLMELHKFEKDEAVKLWNRFGLCFPELHEYRNYLKEEVVQGKNLTNNFGIPVSVELASAYSAINAVIQSTAACILLKAVSNFPKNGKIQLLFTVHDEIIFQAPSSLRSQIPHIVRKWMETMIENVKLPIKLSIGKSWDALNEV